MTVFVESKKEKQRQCKQLELERASISGHNIDDPRPYAALDPSADASGSTTAGAFTEFFTDDVLIDGTGAGDAMGIGGELRQRM